MSKPNPRRGGKSSTRRPARDTEKDESTDRAARSAVPKETATSRGTTATAAAKTDETETKDDGTTNTDTKKDPKEDAPAPKPQSAGATMRDACQKLLNLTMKQEWTSIDPVLKQLEKIVSNSATPELKPLAGVMDPVST